MQYVSFKTVLDAIRNSAQDRIFRLELLQNYNVEDEYEDYQKFLNGDPVQLDGFEFWKDIIDTNLEKNVPMERVRLITYPLTLYTKFEIEWGYMFSVPAGERIYVVYEDEFNSLDLASRVPALVDFWLIDETFGFFLTYDILHRHYANFTIPDEWIPQLCDISRTLLDKSEKIENTSLWKNM